MQKYRILGKKGEGTFSEVLKCQNVDNRQYYACKRMKQHFDTIESVNNLREIQAMRRLSPHANLVELKEVIFDRKTGTVALICELLDMNLYELIKGRKHALPEQKCKNYIYQTLRGLDHMHRNGIFHRDIKPENILIKDEIVKLADLGSCRSVYSKQPYTEYISTRWYRAPECLLTDGYYTYKMDLWGIGCVFYEIMSLRPLFPGANEVDQIAKIHDILGTPSQTLLNRLKKSRHMNFNFPYKEKSGISQLMSNGSRDCLQVIELMCTYDPEERLSAKQILRQPYFKSLRDADKRAAAIARASQTGEDVSHSPAQVGPSKHRRKLRINRQSIESGQDTSSYVPKAAPRKHITSSGMPLQAKPMNKTLPPVGSYTLPKIPVATTKTTTNGYNSRFPGLLKDNVKKKVQEAPAERIDYGKYALPPIDKV
eukprot:Seg163.6 transcript_id=Seg163.6/GoldUCD/mRNA.D3Y31 product="MAPK/MAK/MRK overlapping kinase" protein_id=Seg163.6/GoldUCD/D3Y31